MKRQEKIPPPITRTDELIHALIHKQDEQTKELRRLYGQVMGIRKDLKALRQPAPAPDGQVILKEPGR